MFFFILLYLMLVLIRPQEYPAVEAMHLPLLPVTMACALLGWLLSPRKNFDAPQYRLLPLFLLVMMFSVAVNGWMGGVLAQLGGFAPALILFVLLANACTTAARIRMVMITIVICATVLAVHGMEQAKLGVGWTGVSLIEDGRIQYVGIFNDPNDLGMLFVLTLPMAFYLSGGGGLAGLKRLFWLGCAGMLLYGVYLTNSRGALLGVALVLGIYLWRRWGLVVAGLLGSIGLAGLLLLPSRLKDLSPEEASANGRVQAWYEGFQMFFSRPLFGVGAGNFTDHNELTAHNSYILVLAETGFVGFTLWIAFVGYCLWMMTTILRHRPELADASAVSTWRREQVLATTMLLSLSGCLATAFFLSRSYAVVLYMLAALVVGVYVHARQQFPSLPRFSLERDVVRWPTLAGIALVVLYLVVKILLAFE